MLKYNSKLKFLARKLRKNQTEAEKILWHKIRKKQVNNLKFYRQKIIGNYIVDFYCSGIKLVIEIDGDLHYTDDSKRYDKIREQYLKNLGLKIYRVNNIDIYKNLEGVLDGLYLEVFKSTPNPSFIKEGNPRQSTTNPSFIPLRQGYEG